MLSSKAYLKHLNQRVWEVLLPRENSLFICSKNQRKIYDTCQGPQLQAKRLQHPCVLSIPSWSKSSTSAHWRLPNASTAMTASPLGQNIH
jgi:hypothetical protein